MRLVGYEDRAMRCSDFFDLQEKLPDIEAWVPLAGRIDALRSVKTEEEQALLARAEAIGDAAFAQICTVLKAGMTEREAAAELEYLLKKNGAQGFSFETIMASGAHSSMPHAVPTDKVIEDGDFVTMDFGCIYEGYCSDMTRTVAIGHADDEQRSVYETVLRAQRAAIDAIRPGMTGEEADAVARAVIQKAGYGSCFGHALGHAVGLAIHEDPRLAPGNETVLEPGMAVTIEPGIYLPGRFGVRIEDLVVITADGCRDLTHSPKELLIL